MSKSDEVFVAKESGASQVGDEVYTFTKGITRVRGDHPLLDAVPNYFEPISENLHYEQPHTAVIEPPAPDEPLLHESPDAGAAPDVAEVLEGNIGSVAEVVASTDDMDFLDRLEAAESDSKDRQGVHDAIEARRYTLQTEGEEPPTSGTTAEDGTGDREV